MAVGVACAVAGALGGVVWLYSGTVVAGVLAWRWRPESDPGRWVRGARGEVATAQLLAGLPRRFMVLHDRGAFVGRGNVDHVVVGPTGVWVVDSKVRRAPLRIRHRQVVAGNVPVDVGPAAAQAWQLESVLGVPVRAIVAVHGAGLRRRGKRVDGVLILPAARLVGRLRRGRRRLTRAEIKRLAATAAGVLPPAEVAAH